MRKQKNDSGIIGEQVARKYLKSLGYIILQCNYRTKCGEIDIIAQENETLCFIEVKTHQMIAYGQAASAVTPRKMRCLALAAQFYLMKHALDCPCRFDIIECYYNEAWHFNLIKGAFEYSL